MNGHYTATLGKHEGLAEITLPAKVHLLALLGVIRVTAPFSFGNRRAK